LHFDFGNAEALLLGAGAVHDDIGIRRENRLQTRPITLGVTFGQLVQNAMTAFSVFASAFMGFLSFNFKFADTAESFSPRLQ
jgi:hypothetical protein